MFEDSKDNSGENGGDGGGDENTQPAKENEGSDDATIVVSSAAAATTGQSIPMSMSIPIPNSEKKSDKVQGRDEEKLERCRKRLEAMLTAANASKEVTKDENDETTEVLLLVDLVEFEMIRKFRAERIVELEAGTEKEISGDIGPVMQKADSHLDNSPEGIQVLRRDSLRQTYGISPKKTSHKSSHKSSQTEADEVQLISVGAGPTTPPPFPEDHHLSVDDDELQSSSDEEMEDERQLPRGHHKKDVIAELRNNVQKLQDGVKERDEQFDKMRDMFEKTMNILSTVRELNYVKGNQDAADRLERRLQLLDLSDSALFPSNFMNAYAWDEAWTVEPKNQHVRPNYRKYSKIPVGVEIESDEMVGGDNTHDKLVSAGEGFAIRTAVYEEVEGLLTQAMALYPKTVSKPHAKNNNKKKKKEKKDILQPFKQKCNEVATVLKRALFPPETESWGNYKDGRPFHATRFTALKAITEQIVGKVLTADRVGSPVKDVGPRTVKMVAVKFRLQCRTTRSQRHKKRMRKWKIPADFREWFSKNRKTWVDEIASDDEDDQSDEYDDSNGSSSDDEDEEEIHPKKSGKKTSTTVKRKAAADTAEKQPLKKKSKSK